MQATFLRAVSGLQKAALMVVTSAATSCLTCSVEPLPGTRYTTTAARLMLRPRSCDQLQAFKGGNNQDLNMLGYNFYLHIKDV